ncbi:MAG: sigma-54 dependent transcriptional regulator [Bacillota bacterium]|nr:sigma-54 dependent transcriptional regulator [Bacillota bacterium]
MVGAQDILLADDDPDARELFGMLLQAQGHRVRAVADGASCLREFESAPPDLVILDLKMPPGIWGGLETLRRLRDIDASVPVVVVSNKADVRRAVDSVRAGAYDFIDKSAAAEELPVTVANALRLHQVERRARLLEEENRMYRESQALEFAGCRLVAGSEPMRGLLRLLRRVAPTDATVLVRGETGTGKELVAGAVHYLSPRRDRPLIRVNCAALPESLLEDELFGHEKGAFTGAHARREGRFELADGGTIFLDEVGDMSLATQAKVLRVLEQREFERVGGTRTIKVDVRIAAATNKDLEDMIANGQFREDLYYRLRDVVLLLPPLRDRREDIPELVAALFEEFGDSYAGRRLSPDALAVLMRYDWPGNVRELKSVLKNACIMSETAEVAVRDLPRELALGRPRHGSCEGTALGPS